MKKQKHINIPIFIPHMGCRNQCVFCNQRTISGVSEFDISTVRKTIEDSLKTADASDKCEIAFFGGSFTGIDIGLMKELLSIASLYKKDGRVESIRCSTRPDYIDDEILDILKEYGVGTIELGLQSASDEVLCASKRGHGFFEEKKACELILKHGFKLGGQMMIGLPASTLEDEIYTAKKIVEFGATEARIYPTIVFHKTELAEMVKRNEYKPLEITDAIKRSASALKVFIDANIKVLRIGLCESEGLYGDDCYFAGPMHPALGELVFSEYFYNKIVEKIKSSRIPRNNDVIIHTASGFTSKVVGHKGKNKIRLKTEYGLNIIKVVEDYNSQYDVLVALRERKK